MVSIFYSWLYGARGGAALGTPVRPATVVTEQTRRHVYAVTAGGAQLILGLAQAGALAVNASAATAAAVTFYDPRLTESGARPKDWHEHAHVDPSDLADA